jgi:hypothetical protein
LLSQNDFATWSKDYVLFCHITTHVEGDPHQDLLGKKGGRGFPHMVFMDGEGNVLAQHEGPRSLDGFSTTAEEAVETRQELAMLDGKAAQGDAAAGKEAFLLRLDLGHFDAGQALAHMARLPFTDEEKKELDSAVASLEVMEVLSGLTEDEEGILAAGKHFAGMMAKGRCPGEEEMQPFYLITLRYAESAKDAKVFRAALDGLKVTLAEMMDNPAVTQYLEEQEKALAEIEKSPAGG